MTATAEQAHEALAYLKSQTADLDGKLAALCNHVLDDPAFFVSPGGSKHHHNYKHGLVIHVAEVMRNVRHMSNQVPLVLTVATIWHDFMKIRDYSLTDTGEVLVNDYQKKINHVSGSAIEFVYKARELGFDCKFVENVLHILLSHHGRREWGSPVEPLTKDAWALHSADMLSSRGVVYL